MRFHLLSAIIFCLLFPQAAQPLLAQDATGSIEHSSAPTEPFFIEGQDPKPADKKWTPVPELSDEFNSPELDQEKWQTNPVGNGFAWVGRPPGLFDAKNVKIKDGKMVVTVSKLPKEVEVRGNKFLYQGAIVRSFKPGKPGWYFETRMKANATAMSSTFWLMPNNKSKKRLELDIQECVGSTSEKTAGWAKKWDQIFHSNLIKRPTPTSPKVQIQGQARTETKNHERFYVYAAWWKSPEEVQFFLDGKFAYKLNPTVAWDAPSYIQMAIETYHWNPVPEGGGKIATGTWDERTTQYDWVRVWKLE